VAESGRVAFLSEHASPLALLGGVDAGGQNVYVDEVSRNLGALGYRVDVFTRLDEPNLPAIVDLGRGVRVVNLAVGPPRWVFKDHLWPLMPAFREAVIRFMLREGARYDILHGNFWMSGWVVLELKQRLGIPAVQIFHAMGKTKARHQGGADTSPADRIRVEGDIVTGVDRLIAQCPSELRELVDDYGADPRAVTVIPSAVNIEIFRPVDRTAARRELGLDPEGLVVVYVGRMLPRKDVRNVVRGVAALLRRRDLPVTLLLVGGETPEPDPARTPEIGELERLSQECGIRDRVILIGKRQPDVLRLYYGAADVAVTTPWYEPFGLTPLEAMACGRPVIGSAVGGITFTVGDGVTGYLVPPRDPEALGRRLEELLTRPDRRDQMGRAARRRVEREFTWNGVARRTAALYDEILTYPADPAGIAAGTSRTHHDTISGAVGG
jgi:glycosyltransferase involved in cell wall biosynthesis